MANVIKHKRGSGSDPSASDLILGELAIRTDTGKLFTKMDSGAIAEIAGGGSDIAINTLSSSSGTGGGSATFNGSAYRFTLSAPPNVSAAQLLVSINGVIQKPVAGTGQPSEGFSVDGTDIILGDAPATGSDFFILTFKSLGVSEPADNSVTSAKIVDGAIVNADINASAAIAGSKISPIFTSATEVQNSTFKITDSNPEILLAVPSGGLDSRIINDGSGNLIIGHGVNSDTPTERLRIDSDGDVLVGLTTALSTQAGSIQAAGPILAKSYINSHTSNATVIEYISNVSKIRAYGATSGSGILAFNTGGGGGSTDAERMRIDSSGRVLIGTTSGSDALVVDGGSDAGTILTNSTNSNGNMMTFQCSGTSKFFIGSAGSFITGESGVTNQGIRSIGDMVFAAGSGATERMRLDTSGNVGIGTSSPANVLDVRGSAHAKVLVGTTGTGHATGLQISHAQGNAALQEWQLQTDASADGNLIVRNATTGTAAMFFDADNNNVGIGTTSPTYTNALFGGSQRTFHLSGTTAPQLRIQSSTSGQADLLLQAGNSGSTAYIANAASGGDLFFSTNNGGSQSTKFVIKDNGKVGIGTTSPAGILHISSGNSGDCKLIIEADTDNNDENDNPLIIFRQDGGLEESAIGMGFTSTASDNLLTLANSVTNGGISFATGTTNGYTNAVERVRITTAGKVGIGNTSPSAAVEVTFDSGGSAPSSGTAPEGIAISYGTADGKNGGIWFSPGFGDDQGISGISGSRTSGYQTDLRFYTNNTNSARAFTERMRIDSSGNVGIGTTSPVSKLHLSGNLTIDNSSNAPYIDFVENGDTGDSKARISMDQLSGTSGQLLFYTEESGTLTERMRITSAGKVRIGAVATAAAGKFQVVEEGGGNQSNDCNAYFETNANDWNIKTYYNSAGTHYHLVFLEQGTIRGSIKGNDGSNVTFNQGSDYRWKENIVDLSGSEGIEICKKLKPRKYNWIENREVTGEINTVDGFIAHEVEEAGVLGAVTGEKDAVNEDGSIDGQMLDYGQMTPVLAAAIKGLIARVEALEAK